MSRRTWKPISPGTRRRYDDTAVERMKQRRREGVKIDDIARMFGCTSSTVQKLTVGCTRPAPTTGGDHADR